MNLTPKESAEYILRKLDSVNKLEKENKILQEQLQQKEDIINKAHKKIENMFDIGTENKVIDDLLELQKILDNKGE